MALVGSADRPGLYVESHPIPLRISVAKLLNLVLPKSPQPPPSTKHILPNYAQHEALVCAAFFTACNAGSLRGSTLEDLVTRFVAELIDARDEHYVTLGTVDPIPFDGDFTAKFAFPFDTKIHSDIYELLGTLQTSRPHNKERVDAVTYVQDSFGDMCYQIYVEAKSTADAEYIPDRIKGALQHQDSKA
jgi:hypothetical protein